MADPRPQLAVKPGLNVWRLLRTDRDGAEPKRIPQSAAAAVRYFLGEALAPESNVLVPSGKLEWRVGNARPIEVLDVSRKAGQPLPDGELLADRVQTVPIRIPTVNGVKPWWVLVRFWWRGPEKTIDYPGVKQGLVWPRWSLTDADWLLDRAVHVAEPDVPDPGAATWAEAMGDKAQSALLSATDDLGRLISAGSGFAILALLWFLSNRK